MNIRLILDWIDPSIENNIFLFKTFFFPTNDLSKLNSNIFRIFNSMKHLYNA